MTSRATTRQFDLDTYLGPRRNLIEKALSERLPEARPELLSESMRYSVLSPGKRVRALLSLAAYETIKLVNENSTEEVEEKTVLYIEQYTNDGEEGFRRRLEPALGAACAIEMIHAMSLIHDDLPALDNDDLRRGKPTNHKVFGEAIALLAGDALLMRAIEVLIDGTRESVSPETVLELVRRLCIATGAEGMVGGQVFDLIHMGHSPTSAALSSDSKMDNSFANGSPELSREVIEEIHAGKTASLIKFSIVSGALVAGGSREQIEALERFGDILGLAFQITDDLLDVTGDADTLGKTPGKDQAAEKATWIKVFGLEGASAKLKELEEEGRTLLRSKGLSLESFPVLDSLLAMAIHRKR